MFADCARFFVLWFVELSLVLDLLVLGGYCGLLWCWFVALGFACYFCLGWLLYLCMMLGCLWFMIVVGFVLVIWLLCLFVCVMMLHYPVCWLLRFWVVTWFTCLAWAVLGFWLVLTNCCFGFECLFGSGFDF